jgi:RNA polymerase sigma factor (sigma-70 family)
MTDGGDLMPDAEVFEQHRAHLRAVAQRLLGSAAEAEDAVQEAWLRLERSGGDDIENLRAWLTTVVSRICLNVLRSRTTRKEDPAGVHVPDPVVQPIEAGPEHDAVMAESVSMALLVVLENLKPAERVAFVLHDVFALPFDEIAELVDRTPEATRQLASRARRRVQDASLEPDADLDAQRAAVDAFFTAARGGDLEGLLAVLDPDVVIRGDLGGGRWREIRGAENVAGGALQYARQDTVVHPMLVNGTVGAVITLNERVFSIMAFTVRGGRVVAIDALNDPRRLRAMELPELS